VKINQGGQQGYCKAHEDCGDVNKRCEDHDDCCGDVSCIGDRNGNKRCTMVQRSVNGDFCVAKDGDCSNGMKCCDERNTCAAGPNGVTRVCQALPECWDVAEKNCNEDMGMPGCCAGMACVRSGSSKICMPLPTCAAKDQRCEHVQCCSDGNADLECVPFKTCQGNLGMRCEKLRTENAIQAKNYDENAITKSRNENGNTRSRYRYENGTTESKEEAGGTTTTSSSGSTSLDGWNFIHNMYEAGYSGKDLASKAYKKCNGKTMCIKVLAEPGKSIARSPGDSWIKDYDSGLPGAKYVDKDGKIDWIMSGGKCVGWENCFDVPDFGGSATRPHIEIHANYGEGGASCGRTTSTGKQRQGYMSMRVCQ
jgi:hypothetical protein